MLKIEDIEEYMELEEFYLNFDLFEIFFGIIHK